MENNLTVLETIIANRRTIKPGQMNGKQIPDEQVHQLLQLADWAPTHGNTEPWQFFVYAGHEKVKAFCKDHSALYTAEAGENANSTTVNNLLHMGDLASHLIIAVMRRGDLPKIPALEEIAATSAAVQNLLLGAQAMGLAAYWGSGGMVYKPAMKTYLQLREEDVVLGAIYLGYTDMTKTGNRQIPLEQKVKWM